MVIGHEEHSICFAPADKFRSVGEALFIYLDMQDREP